MTGLHYHREIDGLRAISVAVILLFHLDVIGFNGGFVGVDVFFVVSGFLISQIILNDLKSGAFSFRDFYLRRVLRIIPALAVVVLLTLAAAAYLQNPSALTYSAKQGIFALLSLSNLFFWSDISYWSPNAENYVFLHTWSLGVEEQFYLLYPLMLFVAHRTLGMKGVVVLLLLMLIGGAYANESAFKQDPSAAFYLTHLRFYEFAIGGLGAITYTRLAFLRSSPWLSGALTLAGVAMIMYAALTFNPLTHVLPGYLTLIPTGGALLVILAGASAPANILLSNAISNWLGKVSYSLYLVHWPIITLYRYRFGGHLDAGEQVVLGIATLLAAELLCRGVERRFRLQSGGAVTMTFDPVKTALARVAALVGIILVGSGLLIYSDGWPGRLDEKSTQLLAIDVREEIKQTRQYFEEHCVPHTRPICGQKDPELTNILLLGDSRALDIYIALKVAYPEAAIRASSLMGCSTVFSAKASFSRFTPDCAEQNAIRLQAALDSGQQDIIFLANALGPWRSEAIAQTVERLRAEGKQVYLLGQFMTLKDRTPIDVAIDAHRFGEGPAFVERFMANKPFVLDDQYADRIRASGATYVSNKPFFFDGNYRVDDPATGKLLTYDGTHLNRHGAKLFGLFLKKHYPLP